MKVNLKHSATHTVWAKSTVAVDMVYILAVTLLLAHTHCTWLVGECTFNQCIWTHCYGYQIIEIGKAGEDNDNLSSYACIKLLCSIYFMGMMYYVFFSCLLMI